MAFVFTPEDGTGLSTSNSYITQAFADDYQAGRGRSDWASATQADKEAAMVRATDYIEFRFGRRFRGYRRAESQALEWPRLSAFDNDDILWNGDNIMPDQLQKATAEYSLIALRIGELAPNPPLPTGDEPLDGTASTDDESNSGIVTAKRERVGPIEEETKYAALTSVGSKQAGGRVSQSALNSDFYLPEYPRADQWLEELITNPYSRRLVRG